MRNNQQNLAKITELLSDNQYHDGTSMGKQLNISRAAVWKVIKKLEQYAIDIKSVKGKGYLLQTPLILLDDEKIKAGLHTQSIQIELLEKIDSTNDYLKSFIEKNKAIRVCIAESQTQGKGRLNRQWHSPFGKNIYLSLLYPFQKDISELSGLSLVVGLAISQAIESMISSNEKFAVKWPNDIIVNGHKIAGTLIEIQAESNGFCQVIIGIGINVNMQDANKKQIDQAWSSLLMLTEKYHDRNQLCAALINHLMDYLERFTHDGLIGFVEEWQNKDALFGKSTTISAGNTQHQGICAGINEQGHLLLKMQDETIKAFASGDATLQASSSLK